MKEKYRIMVYNGVSYGNSGYASKIVKKYKPQELKYILWGLFSYWENIGDYEYDTEEDATRPINNLKLHRKAYGKNNVTYIKR